MPPGPGYIGCSPVNDVLPMIAIGRTRWAFAAAFASSNLTGETVRVDSPKRAVEPVLPGIVEAFEGRKGEA